MAARPDPFLPWSEGLLVESVVQEPGDRCAGTAPHWVLGLTLSGECDHGRPGGRRLRNRRGDLVLIRPGTAQSWLVTGSRRWRTIYAVFDARPHWESWLMWPQSSEGFARIALDRGEHTFVRCAFARALADYHGGRDDAVDRAYHAVEAILLRCRERADLRPDVQADPRLEHARRLLAADVAVPITLADVAARSGLSRTQLALRFKASTGLAPMAFRARCRVERAADLLRIPYLPIKSVAHQVGFTSARAFSTCFRRLKHTTPRRFRLRCMSDGRSGSGAGDAVGPRRRGTR